MQCDQLSYAGGEIVTCGVGPVIKGKLAHNFSGNTLL